MKKLVLAMACVLSLALLASCKQAASTTDVNLKNQEFQTASNFYGDASFAAAFVTLDTANATTGISAYKADTATTNQSVAYSSAKQLAKISWSENSQSESTNYETYTFVVPFVWNSNTAATTNTSGVLAYGTWTFTIEKIGDDYFAKITNDSTGSNWTKLEFTDGNPEASEFVIKSLGVVDADPSDSGVKSVSLTNVKFTRK